MLPSHPPNLFFKCRGPLGAKCLKTNSSGGEFKGLDNWRPTHTPKNAGVNTNTNCSYKVKVLILPLFHKWIQFIITALTGNCQQQAKFPSVSSPVPWIFFFFFFNGWFSDCLYFTIWANCSSWFNSSKKEERNRSLAQNPRGKLHSYWRVEGLSLTTGSV